MMPCMQKPKWNPLQFGGESSALHRTCWRNPGVSVAEKRLLWRSSTNTYWAWGNYSPSLIMKIERLWMVLFFLSHAPQQKLLRNLFHHLKTPFSGNSSETGPQHLRGNSTTIRCLQAYICLARSARDYSYAKKNPVFTAQLGYTQILFEVTYGAMIVLLHWLDMVPLPLPI